MTKTEHHLYWISVFSSKMAKVPQYSIPWYETNTLRAAQIREWRTENTLTAVK